MNIWDAHGLRVRRVILDGETIPSTSHVPPSDKILTFDLVCPATDTLEGPAPWGEEPLDGLVEKFPHLDRFYTSGRWYLSRLFNRVQGRRRPVSAREWLVLDPYGDELLPRRMRQEIGSQCVFDTIAIDKSDGSIFGCTFHRVLGGVEVYLSAMDRRVPAEYLENLDELRSQKRPFRLSLPERALFRFFERRASYPDLEEELLVCLRLADSTLEVGKDVYRETSSWVSSEREEES